MSVNYSPTMASKYTAWNGKIRKARPYGLQESAERPYSIEMMFKSARSMKKTLLAFGMVCVLTVAQYQTAMSLAHSLAQMHPDEGLLILAMAAINASSSANRLALELPQVSEMNDDYVNSFGDEDNTTTAVRRSGKGTTASAGATNRASDSFSSCLMVMDDNHRLAEWLAYHYTTLNLRHLVILSDPRSRFSPTETLKKWRRYMTIEEWTEDNYMDDDFRHRSRQYFKKNQTDRRVRQAYHMERQSKFIRQCSLHLQTLNKTWVSFHDIDEYYVINSELVPNATARMAQPGSVVSLLNQVQDLLIPLQSISNPDPTTDDHYSGPCVTTYRVPYGAVPSTDEQVQDSVPDFIPARKMETLRWRHQKPPKNINIQIGKSIIDVSRVPDLKEMAWPDRSRTPFSPHRLLPICPAVHHYSRAYIRINHYVGSWEYYSYRVNDGRKGANKNRQAWEAKSNLTGGTVGDEARPWIQGFVQIMGADTAELFLQDVGLPDNYTAPVDSDWMHPGDRKKLLKANGSEASATPQKPKQKDWKHPGNRNKQKKKGKKKAASSVVPPPTAWETFRKSAD